MDVNNQINYGERALFCAIIELAIHDFIGMADDPKARKSIRFETAEKFLFNNEPVKRDLLRDPKTGEPLQENSGHYVDCTLQYLCDILSVDDHPLDVNYIRDGIIKKLEKKRHAETSEVRQDWWTPNKDRTIQEDTKVKEG
jgi:hypothetical protein